MYTLSDCSNSSETQCKTWSKFLCRWSLRELGVVGISWKEEWISHTQVVLALKALMSLNSCNQKLPSHSIFANETRFFKIILPVLTTFGSRSFQRCNTFSRLYRIGLFNFRISTSIDSFNFDSSRSRSCSRTSIYVFFAPAPVSKDFILHTLHYVFVIRLLSFEKVVAHENSSIWLFFSYFVKRVPYENRQFWLFLAIFYSR